MILSTRPKKRIKGSRDIHVAKRKGHKDKKNVNIIFLAKDVNIIITLH